MSNAQPQPDPQLAVLDGVVQRLAGQFAQSQVTIAELDVRLQMQTALTVRAESERDQLREQAGPAPDAS